MKIPDPNNPLRSPVWMACLLLFVLMVVTPELTERSPIVLCGVFAAVAISLRRIVTIAILDQQKMCEGDKVFKIKPIPEDVECYNGGQRCDMEQLSNPKIDV